MQKLQNGGGFRYWWRVIYAPRAGGAGIWRYFTDKREAARFVKEKRKTCQYVEVKVMCSRE